MPLLSSESASPDALTLYKNSVLARARILYARLRDEQLSGLAQVWSPPSGFTPQQVCEALGKDAAHLFAFHGLLTDFLVKVQQLDGIPVDVALPPNAFTKNADGTVTVDTTKPYTQ